MSRNTTDRNSREPSQQPTSSTRPPARRGPSGAWSRLKPAVSDPLDAYGLPSKGESRLHDLKTQENYYGKIVERYMKFCATSSSSGEGLEKAFAALSVQDASPLTPTAIDETPNSSSSSSGGAATRPSLVHRVSATERPNDLPNILLAMRKLREGILGSRRCDAFAQRAYMFIIHAGILTQSWESYQPALLYLLDSIHAVTPLSVPELQEFVGYRVLDLACRQYELTQAYSLRLEFRHRDRKVAAVLKCLVHDDWVRFWRIRRAVDGYQRAVMEFATERMRLHVLKCLGKGYMTADKTFVEKSTDEAWAELVKSGVGWELQEGGNVIIRKPKAK